MVAILVSTVSFCACKLTPKSQGTPKNPPQIGLTFNNFAGFSLCFYKLMFICIWRWEAIVIYPLQQHFFQNSNGISSTMPMSLFFFLSNSLALLPSLLSLLTILYFNPSYLQHISSPPVVTFYFPTSSVLTRELEIASLYSQSFHLFPEISSFHPILSSHTTPVPHFSAFQVQSSQWGFATNTILLLSLKRNYRVGWKWEETRKTGIQWTN